MNNTLLALELLNAALAISTKVQDMLQKAASENRDVTDDELIDLKTFNDQLENKILND